MEPAPSSNRHHPTRSFSFGVTWIDCDVCVDAVLCVPDFVVVGIYVGSIPKSWDNSDVSKYMNICERGCFNL